MGGIATAMSTAGSAGSAASRGEAARARTERANELRRNSRESGSTRAAEPEPKDGNTLPAELTQTTTRAEHASRGARRHAESLTETVKLLAQAPCSTVKEWMGLLQGL